MDELFRDMKEQTDTFYRCCVGLMLKDFKTKGMTLEQAYDLYSEWSIATIYKNGLINFISEVIDE